jgi:hypothetical protein
VVQRWLLLAGCAVLAVGLTACNDEPETLLGLEVGDCFDEPDTDEIIDVEVVACEEPHDAEVFALLDLDDLPDEIDEQELFDTAEERCVDRFDGYVGTDYLSSRLHVLALVPTEEAWLAGDRNAACYVVDGEGEPLTGSVEGTGT